MSPALKPIEPERRFDVRKGLNTAFSPDALDEHELRYAQNLQLYEYAGLITRGGTKRLHNTVLEAGAAPVLGLRQWDAPAGKQLVAICNGHFFHKLEGAAEFTKVASTLSTTERPGFATFRIGPSIFLYFADGTLRRWDGATLTTSFLGAPPCTMLLPYKGRMLAAGDPNFPKRVYGSAVTNPTKWSPADGGLIMDAEQYDEEPVTGLAKAGSSVLIFKPDAIQRFTGLSVEDMDLDRDSEGVSREVGCIARHTIVEIEGVVYFLSDRGVYKASEAGVEPVSAQLEDVWKRLNKSAWRKSYAVHNAHDFEYRLWVPVDANTQNLTGYFHNYRTGGWTGPHTGTAFGASALAEYEHSGDVEGMVIGGYDGWVRELDVGLLDDVTRAGSGGTGIPWDVEYSVLFFGTPKIEKDLDVLHVQADLGAAQAFTPYWIVDQGSEQVGVAVASLGAGMRPYEVGRLDGYGRRFRFGLRGTATDRIRIAGFELDAHIYAARR